MSLPWYDNFIGHFAAGFTVSLADRAFSINAKRHTEKRVAAKLEEVTALEYLASNPLIPTLEKGTEERATYNDSVIKARNYFERKGVSSLSPQRKGFLDKVSGVVHYIKGDHERINNLSAGKTLITAFGTELFLDSMVVTMQALSGVGNGLSAIGRTPYQTIAFFGGMQVGKGFLYAKDLFRTKEERELDSIAEELTSDGKLLGIVQTYSSTASLEVPEVLEAGQPKMLGQDSEVSGNLGERVGVRIADAAEGVQAGFGEAVGAIKDRLNARKNAKKQAEEARQEILKDKYKDY